MPNIKPNPTKFRGMCYTFSTKSMSEDIVHITAIAAHDFGLAECSCKGYHFNNVCRHIDVALHSLKQRGFEPTDG